MSAFKTFLLVNRILGNFLATIVKTLKNN